MNTLIIALAALFAIAPQQQRPTYTPDDYAIVSDTVTDNVRTIIATPSPLVCSKKFTIKVDTKTDKIIECTFLRGCEGNLKAISVLLKGMTVQEVVRKLDGNTCGRRGTSCMDQLSRILKECYKIKNSAI